MLTDFAQVFGSIMGLVVLVGGVVTVISMAASSRSVLATGWVAAARDSAVWLMCLITWGSMIGSLYFSEVAHYAPCKLCWYQRIAMYSMAVITLVAAVRRDSTVARYTVVLAGLGLIVSVYHYMVEWYPSLESSVCSLDVPCTTIWFRQFGFVTLAFIAGSVFIAVLSLSLVLLRQSSTGTSNNEE